MEPATFSSLDSFEESLHKLEDAAHQLTSCKPDFEQVWAAKILIQFNYK